MTANADAKSLLKDVNATLLTIERSFQLLAKQSSALSAVSPTTNDVGHSLSSIRQRLAEQDKSHDAQIKASKLTIELALRQGLESSIKTQVQQSIDEELPRQVSAQVDSQIMEYVPLPLTRQLEEIQARKRDIGISLRNSKARRKNSSLLASNLDERLERIQNNTGVVSELYPADIRSLIFYDDDSLEELLRDYNLEVEPNRAGNINKFMTHIGIDVAVTLPNTPVEDS